MTSRFLKHQGGMVDEIERTLKSNSLGSNCDSTTCKLCDLGMIASGRFEFQVLVYIRDINHTFVSCVI